MIARMWRILALMALFASALPAQNSGVGWHDDFDAARKIAAERRAPLLVVFRCEP